MIATLFVFCVRRLFSRSAGGSLQDPGSGVFDQNNSPDKSFKTVAECMGGLICRGDVTFV
jgi:hypothetical protein